MEQCSTEGCFNPRAEGRGKVKQCLECLARYQREYYHRNKHRFKKVRFVLGTDEYVRILERQGQRCANPACRLHVDDAPNQRLMPDENRRSLLCDHCNRARHALKSNPELVQGLLDYLNGRETRPAFLAQALSETTRTEDRPSVHPIVLSKALLEPIENSDQPVGPQDEDGAGRSR